MFTAKRFAAVLATSLVLSASAPLIAQAKGDAQAGATKAAVCTACHGSNGNSINPEWPSLAGQNAVYISEQLKLFRAGHRNNAVMYPMSVGLTDADIADVAAYFASQTPVGLEADAATYKAGESLYRGGDRARNIPACSACHGPVGLGNPGAGYPAMRAQHATYTISQLSAYAAESRYVDAAGTKQKARNSHMMTTIARRLSGDDVKSLASYIQGLR